MTGSDALVPFGFTALESEIYVFLLGESPATGYRVAQGINKPAANTYKAIQTLQSKGAILVEEGSSRFCRAVPIEDLMGRLQKDFEARRVQTVKALKSAGRPQEDERLYHLKSRDQILNRAREMLAEATSEALIQMPAFGVHAIEGAIEKAADRGIEVFVLTTESIIIEGAEVAVAEDPAGLLCVVIDGTQTLAGKISQDEESDALWTRYPTLAQIHHGALSAEITLANVSGLLAADEKRSRIQKAVDARRRLT